MLGNRIVCALRSVYHPLHFSRGYNFLLFFIFGGALFGFSLSRTIYFDFYGVFCRRGDRDQTGAAPGECFFYAEQTRYKVGILIHLATILPAGMLVPLQFVPWVRHRVLLLHRINGYFILLLSVLTLAGVLMVADESFGGDLHVQALIGLLSIAFLLSLVLAWWNIKKLQIDQHRAWMLRAWIYAGSIITTRIIMIIMATIISNMDRGFFVVRRCDVIDYIFEENQSRVLRHHPGCASYYHGTDPTARVVVRANMNGVESEIAAALGVCFGAGIWLAFFIHVLGAELYLQLTPREAERLRQVSYQKQLAAGMKNPGNAGLTVQKLGDAEPWRPQLAQAGRVLPGSAEDMEAREMNGSKCQSRGSHCS